MVSSRHNTSLSKKRNLLLLQKDPTRDIAFDVLRACLNHRYPLTDSLLRAVKNHQADPRDRAAAHRLAATTLRYFGTLRTVIEPFLHKEPPESVQIALIMGCTQLLYLDTPPHAAVNTIVSLLHRYHFSPFAGLANAVLRKIATAGRSLLKNLDQPRLNIPQWLWRSWSMIGPDVPRAIATTLCHEAPLDITLRPNLLNTILLDTMLESGGMLLPNGSLRFSADTVVTQLPNYAEGAFWVQDVAASLPATLLSVQKGENVTDLCAAPGGKTAQLALTGANVTAIENNPARIAQLQDTIKRLQIAVNLIQADATTWNPDVLQDAILIDAPCSATGIARRHPDVLWTKRQSDITTLTLTQDRLIAAAKNMIRPGGRMIYTVCSLQKEEGPDRAKAAESMGFTPAPFTREELAFLPDALTPEGWLRTHPGLWQERGGMDGFFAARFIRKN